jgi:hypothetical protein
MKSTSLSTIAIDLVQSYGNTANNVIKASRVGGERISSYLEDRYMRALASTGKSLSQEARNNALATEKFINGYYLKGITLATDSASAVVGGMVKFTGLGMSQVAANASKFEDKTGMTALNTLAQAAVPAAIAVKKIAVQIEAKSADLVKVLTPESKVASAFRKARARRA